MYSYLKKEDLLNGLKALELKFKDFEDDMKADPEVVEAALAISQRNIQDVNVKYFLKKEIESMQALKEMYPSLAPSNILEIMSIHPSLKAELLDKKVLSSLLFPILNSFNVNWSKVAAFKDNYKEHPFFTDVEYFWNVLSEIESELTRNEYFQESLSILVYSLIKSFQDDNEPQLDAFLSNYKTVCYLIFTGINCGDSFNDLLPKKYAVDEKLCLETLNFLTSEPIYEMIVPLVKDLRQTGGINQNIKLNENNLLFQGLMIIVK